MSNGAADGSRRWDLLCVLFPFKISRALVASLMNLKSIYAHVMKNCLFTLLLNENVPAELIKCKKIYIYIAPEDGLLFRDES